MQIRADNNRIFWRALAVVLFLHALLLLIPPVRQAVFETDGRLPIQVRRGPSGPPEPVPEEVAPEPVVVQQARREPVEFAAPEPIQNPAPVPASPTEVPPAPRLLSRQFDYEKTPDPLAGISRASTMRTDANFYFRDRTNLDVALNEPSLQLPFEDTRIYLVNSYDPGLMGGVDRFFDKLTVPFGFTTKHGTRIECAWVLVLAGCSWGPVRSYYQGMQAKRRNPE